jgi:NitT/TauT family transport system substrate-binding protein
MHVRKRLTVALAAVALVLAGCGGDSESASSGQDRVIRAAVTDAMLPFYYPWGVAATQGFWTDEGLKVDILPASDGSSAMMQQLIGGNADVAHPGPTVLFNAIEEGYQDDVEVFGTWPYNQGFNLRIPEGKDVITVDDLKGKTIGVSDLSGGEVPLLRATLAARGLAESDYTLLPIGGGEPQTIDALQKGEVDVYCTANKDFIAMEQLGLKFTDITFPEWASLTANIFVTTKSVAEQRPEDLEKYLRGLVRAVIFTHDNPEAALAGMKEAYPEVYTDLDDNFSIEWMKLTEQRIYLPELADSKSLFTVDRAGIEGYEEFLRGVGDISPDTKIDLDSLINDEIAKKANDFDYASVQ